MRLLPKEGVLTIGGRKRQPCDFKPAFKDLEERQSANGFAMPVGSSKAMMSNQKSSQDSRQEEGLEKNYDERVLYGDATAIVYQTRASSLATPQRNAHSQQ